MAQQPKERDPLFPQRSERSLPIRIQSKIYIKREVKEDFSNN